MPTLTKRDARKHLQEALFKELTVLAPTARDRAAGAIGLDIGRITNRIVKIFETDESAASCVALLNPSAPPPSAWIRTEEVAGMLGYSRPYVTALLDSDDFAGKVRRSKGGQRSVKKDDVQAWMDARHLGGPATAAKRDLLADSPDEFFIEDAVPEDATAALRRIAQENSDSDKHRPKRRASSK